MNASLALKTLQVDSNASFEDVKSSYRKLVLELHPDKNSKNTDDEFKKITVAYHVLKKWSNEKNFNINRDFKQTYTNTETKSKQTFSQKRSKWGGAPDDKIPEEDWGKFTKEFEEDNPTFWKTYEKKFWQEYDAYLKKDGLGGEFDKAKEPKDFPNINVEVDPSLCIACCSCVTIAPEVFEIDNARMNPKSHVINRKGAGFNKIMTAAETCPTKAIKVENEKTKERLYPW